MKRIIQELYLLSIFLNTSSPGIVFTLPLFLSSRDEGFGEVYLQVVSLSRPVAKLPRQKAPDSLSCLPPHNIFVAILYHVSTIVDISFHFIRFIRVYSGHISFINKVAALNGLNRL